MNDQTIVDRRTLIAAAGLVVAAGVAGSKTLAAEEGAVDHSQHGASTAGVEHQALITAAVDCLNKGNVCVNHCVASLSTGDTMLKDCLKTVLAMLPMCETLAALAAQDAARLKEFAKVCMDVCDDCEKECRKHETHHATCKSCAESCAACIKECKALIGA